MTFKCNSNRAPESNLRHIHNALQSLLLPNNNGKSLFAILSVAETISRIVVRSRRQIVCHRQCGKNREHNEDFTLTQIAVLQENEHYYQQKQKPIVVKHKSPL